MMHVNQFQHVNNFLNLEVANDLRQFFGCVCGWMIGGNQRMETLNMGAPTIDCSFRFLFFWWFGEWKICGRHAQCPEKSMQGIAPKMCDLTREFFLRGMELEDLFQGLVSNYLAGSGSQKSSQKN